MQNCGKTAEKVRVLNPLIGKSVGVKTPTSPTGATPLLETTAQNEKSYRQRRCCRRCESRWKRGKRAGIRHRLVADPTRPALPLLFLANVRSLDNTMHIHRLRMAAQCEFRNCCAFVFTETWLHDNNPDSAVQMDGLTTFRADRNLLSGKTKGGEAKYLCEKRLLCKLFCSGCSLF